MSYISLMEGKKEFGIYVGESVTTINQRWSRVPYVDNADNMWTVGICNT